MACDIAGDVNVARCFGLTWCGYTPVFHWSEGIGSSSKHADYASYLPEEVRQLTGAIWECELKMKDKAILKIVSDLL